MGCSVVCAGLLCSMISLYQLFLFSGVVRWIGYDYRNDDLVFER